MSCDPDRILSAQKLIGQETSLAVASNSDLPALAECELADDQLLQIFCKVCFPGWISIVERNAGKIVIRNPALGDEHLHHFRVTRTFMQEVLPD